MAVYLLGPVQARALCSHCGKRLELRGRPSGAGSWYHAERGHRPQPRPESMRPVPGNGVAKRDQQSSAEDVGIS